MGIGSLPIHHMEPLPASGRGHTQSVSAKGRDGVQSPPALAVDHAKCCLLSTQSLSPFPLNPSTRPTASDMFSCGGRQCTSTILCRVPLPHFSNSQSPPFHPNCPAPPSPSTYQPIPAACGMACCQREASRLISDLAFSCRKPCFQFLAHKLIACPSTPPTPPCPAYTSGLWHGLLSMGGFQAGNVSARQWKRDLGLIGKEKDASR